MVIFVEEDGHGAIAGHGAAEADHFSDAGGDFDAVAVD
jgi:hypothetical protein